jgi:hypothetical protein
MDPTDPNLKSDLARLDACLAHLGEHFDTVQIFTTKHDGGDDATTHSFKKGIGNWYARFGQVMEWVTQSNEDARIDVRKNEE